MNLGTRFQESVKKFATAPAIQWKENGAWKIWTYLELGRSVEEAGRGLMALGVRPGDHVVLYSPNLLEWTVCDLAIVSIGGVTVPIYSTSTADTVLYIARHSESKIFIVGGVDQLARTVEIQDRLPDTSSFVSLTPSSAASNGLWLSLSDLREKGSAVPRDEFYQRGEGVASEDLATIIYTSGTTGEPKGVMLTHRNIYSNCDDSLARFHVGPGDVTLSFLPLSHALERTGGMYLMLFAGCAISMAESMATVPQDLQDVRPTVMITVPRLLEKFYVRIQETMAQKPALVRQLFNFAVRYAKGRSEKRNGILYALFDVLFFRKLRARMGGRLRIVVSGGAALSAEISRFFSAVGIPVLQGYGLTETSPVIAINPLERNKHGTIGPAIPGVEVRLAEDGELWARGANIMKGYYKNAEATAETITPDGWLKTGDIAQIDADGYITITDRKKELIKTSGGKYIAPQPMENELKLSTLIEQACVVGEGQKYAAVLLVPNFAVLEARARAAGIAVKSREDLVAHLTVREWYGEVLKKFNEGKATYETIKKFELLPGEWTIEGGEITPTMKLRRKVIGAKYATEISRLFA